MRRFRFLLLACFLTLPVLTAAIAPRADDAKPAATASTNGK